MNFFEILYNIIIAPPEMIIETVFCVWLTKIELFGAAGAIVAVSLAVGFLTLPIYNVADAIQKRERDIQHSMASGIKRIKDTFTGDEWFMMMQTFYREHHWSPVYALRSSLSIIIEVPFFIAAYHFLSHCPALQGISCGILRDLGKPDGLIAFSAGGGRSLASVSGTLNLLPILMTAINAVSSAVYLKGFSVREKAQTYCLALIFLVLLYNSPSGLVLYWTLNNLFSLAKNVVQRWVKHTGLVVHGVIAAAMLLSSVYMIATRGNQSLGKRLAVLLATIVFTAAPYVVRLIQTRVKSGASRQANPSEAISMTDTLLFFASAMGLALLCGLMLPSAIVMSDPVEFSVVGGVDNLLYYVVRNLCVFTGLFVLWPVVIYFMLGSGAGDGYTQDEDCKLCVIHNKKMFGKRVKRAMPVLFLFLLLMALFDVYAAGYAYGNMDTFMTLDNAQRLQNYSPFFVVAPIAAAILCAAAVCLVMRFSIVKYAAVLCMALCAAEATLGAARVHTIMMEREAIAAEDNDSSSAITPIYHLSKTGKNVVVLFLDRAISSFFPYIVRQFPHLAKDFDGFVYYPNTVSFADTTSKASPALMGGYEYTPEAENERRDMLLVDKHDEAMLLSPRLFDEAGWQVTVTDPPWPDYNMGGNPFEYYPDISYSRLKNRYKQLYMAQMRAKGTLHDEEGVPARQVIASHIMMFCVMQQAMPILRYTIYNDGAYYRVQQPSFEQKCPCLLQYANIYYLKDLTDNSAKKDTYTFIYNDLPHQPAILKEPEYEPADNVDEKEASSGYYKWKLSPAHGASSDMAHYHVNAAAMLQTAKWLNGLKALGIYDNTRIIIVADHGGGIPTPLREVMDEKTALTCAAYNPLLMMKDFGAHSTVRTDSTFMTNADTILLAKDGLDISDINPFTGKSIAAAADKTEARIYPVVVRKDYNEGIVSVYLRDKKLWILGKECHPLAVRGNIFDENNWTAIGGKE